MTFIRLTKIFSFEMAHMLSHHKGLCKNLHGHSYELHVTLGGQPNQNQNIPDSGMVIDYSEIKKIVYSSIIDVFDHAVTVNKNANSFLIKTLYEMESKVVLLDFEPTSENLLIFMVEKLKRLLPGRIKLIHLKLYETRSSYAEWRAEDNHLI